MWKISPRQQNPKFRRSSFSMPSTPVKVPEALAIRVPTTMTEETRRELKLEPSFAALVDQQTRTIQDVGVKLQALLVFLETWKSESQSRKSHISASLTTSSGHVD